MKFKQKIMASALALGLVTSSVFVSNADIKSQQLEVHFINVGQGDATYIELPDGTDMLIDSGDGKYGKSVVNYLKNQEKDIDIEYLIATHPDSDHVGGMQEVFKQLNIKNFYYPTDAPHTTQTWKNVLDLASKEGCSIKDAKTGTNLNIGGAEIKFIQPTKDYEDRNDDSVVTLVNYCNKKVLLTGDIGENTENDMVSQNLVPDVDILKVAHHGSAYSSTQSFLNKAKAENAVISVGKDNSYGHPNANAINRLTAAGSKIWRTDVTGDIVAKLDCSNLTINGQSVANGNTSSKNNWVQENGSWYYYKNGVKQKGWIQDSNKWYYLNSAGVMQKGWTQVNGVWYYLQSNGAMTTGWQQAGKNWYYLKQSGAMATGWQQVGSNWYYLRGSGVMATGWEQVGNSWYYLENSGVMAKGWKQLSGNWYYLNNGGAMSLGWQQIQGKWYYFYGSGVMATNTTIGGWNINASGVGTPPSTGGTSNGGSSNNNGSTSDTSGIVYANGGSSSSNKYHKSPNAHGMKDAIKMTRNQAKSKGYIPCGSCYR